jgi:putative transposase
MRFFNPHDDTLITQRKLPHWAQDGAVVFITWRTVDSMPQQTLEAWRTERFTWLSAHGIDPSIPGWKTKVQDLPADQMTEYHDLFTTRWHEHLDAGHGACLLQQPEFSQIVHDSLLHFHGQRYDMHAFVIMPNHVHLLATFADRAGMLQQCESWKHYTAHLIHRQLGTKGRFWQQDAFDHLVRHENQFQRLEQYIAENPTKAGLRPDQARVWINSSHHRSA